MDGDGDAELVERLRAGDEAAFVALVDRYHLPLLRFAQTFVSTRAVAEEVVQDTWLGVVRGVDRFEGRSSFKTWLFRILANRARTTGAREKRGTGVSLDDPTVPADRFDENGGWRQPPTPWTDDVDARLDAKQRAARVAELLVDLPASQREVVVLRDVEGLSTVEVCELLDITPGNQRVLLHRGRAALRALLDQEVAS